MKCAVIAFLTFVAFVSGSKWDSRNNPGPFGSNFVFNLNQLSTNGSVETSQIPWSDTYWPSHRSGIAHRWQLSTAEDFSYSLNNMTALQSMSIDLIRQLSPAEKYDIFNGRYDYPTVKSEWSRTSPQDAGWEGICHGWAPASLIYTQPKPVTLTNADGIAIPFGSSDVKALLSYFLAEVANQQAKTYFVGERCNFDLQSDEEARNKDECADQNAGSFHVILGNMLGNSQKTGFVIDYDRSIQVWNQPLYAFTSQISDSRPPSNGSAYGTVKEVKVETTISYGKETGPQWESHPPNTLTQLYSYWLELDANGNIIGGNYPESAYDRVDFSWYLSDVEFFGYFSKLNDIYTASTSRKRGVMAAQDLKITSRHKNLHSSTGHFGVEKYGPRHEQSWSIVTRGAKSIKINFENFDTERYRDKVKIFEGAQGEGALLAVLHGQSVPREIIVNAPAAYIVFTSDGIVHGKGFSATYSVAH